MILGLSTYAYGWAVANPHDAMDETGLIETSLRFGLKCIQIGDNLPLHSFSTERIDKLKKRLREHAIRIEVGARTMTDENLERYIKICRDLNSPLLRFVIDGDRYEPDVQRVEAVIRNSLGELEKRNIVLGIENHDRFKARDLAAVMENVGSPYVGVCLDCVNSLGAGEGLEHVAERLAPHTVNLHIKDFRIERLPHKMGFTVRGERVGKGMMDLGQVMSLLAKYNRCQSAVLEQWVPPEKDLTATITKERAWADEGIVFLQSGSWFTQNQTNK